MNPPSGIPGGGVLEYPISLLLNAACGLRNSRAPFPARKGSVESSEIGEA